MFKFRSNIAPDDAAKGRLLGAPEYRAKIFKCLILEA